MPRSLAYYLYRHLHADAAYKVYDPSFDPRPVKELVRANLWMRERVQQIGQALQGGDNALVAASRYRALIQTVDPDDI
jgi:hypothetical protein